MRATGRRNPFFTHHEVAGSLASDRPLPLALQSALDAHASLSAIGFEPSAWAELPDAQMPSQLEEERSFDLTRGWQLSQAVNDFCHRPSLRQTDAASAALLDSQAGPHAVRVFTTRPTLPEFSLESANVDGELITTTERYPRRLAFPAPARQLCGVNALCAHRLCRSVPQPVALALGLCTGTALLRTLASTQKTGARFPPSTVRNHGVSVRCGTASVCCPRGSGMIRPSMFR